MNGRWIAVFVLMLAAGEAHGQGVRAPDNFRELFAYLRQCVSLPAGSEGSEITLRFSLTHYGALRGKPMISYSKLTGDAATQRLFVSSALAALERCTPVPVTEAFGRVVGQRVLAWRLRSGPPDAPL